MIVWIINILLLLWIEIELFFNGIFVIIVVKIIYLGFSRFLTTAMIVGDIFWVVLFFDDIFGNFIPGNYHMVALVIQSCILQGIGWSV